MRHTVTIGIPVYKVEPYIRKTLLSAMEQTVSDTEILVVDDCGGDRSMDIVRELQSNHPRGNAVRILTQPHNMGVSAARNRIIDEATGDYLFFLDADDIIAPTCIATLRVEAERSGAQVVYGSYDKIGLDGAVVDHHTYPHTIFTEEDALAHYAYRKLGGIQAMVCNILFDTAFLRSTGLRMIKSNFWEDFVFNFDLVTLVSRAALIPDVTYYYLCREGSLSNYQSRSAISKSEVMANAATIDHLKETSLALVGKTYMGKRLNCILKMDYYIVRDILRRKGVISPSVTRGELRRIMRLPFTFGRLMSFKGRRAQNALLYLFGKLLV